MYDDGWCLDCQPFGAATYSATAAPMPAFTSTPSVVSAVSGADVVGFGSDGLPKQTVLSGHISDALWSAQGGQPELRRAAARLRSLARKQPIPDPAWRWYATAG